MGFTNFYSEVASLRADVEALKLALYGRLTELPANSLVGSITGGVAGTIDLPLATNLGGTGAAGVAGSFGSTDIKGKKSTWAGIGFPDAYGAPIFMQNDSSFFNGMWSNSSGHPDKWLWWYQDGQFKVFGNSASKGSFIALDKGLGSLPGYPSDRYPTIKTDFDACYFSVAGQFSAQITANGVYTAVSDFNRKENIQEVNYQDVLERIKYLPVCEYSFKGSDPRIKSISTFAQAFWLAFGLGGDIENVEENSPTQPNKMMATSDVAGVCLAAIKGLLERVEELERSHSPDIIEH